MKKKVLPGQVRWMPTSETGGCYYIVTAIEEGLGLANIFDLVNNRKSVWLLCEVEKDDLLGAKAKTAAI